jgi:hypothetical protein
VDKNNIRLNRVKWQGYGIVKIKLQNGHNCWIISCASNAPCNGGEPHCKGRTLMPRARFESSFSLISCFLNEWSEDRWQVEKYGKKIIVYSG